MTEAVPPRLSLEDSPSFEKNGYESHDVLEPTMASSPSFSKFERVSSSSGLTQGSKRQSIRDGATLTKLEDILLEEHSSPPTYSSSPRGLASPSSSASKRASSGGASKQSVSRESSLRSVSRNGSKRAIERTSSTRSHVSIQESPTPGTYASGGESIGDDSEGFTPLTPMSPQRSASRTLLRGSSFQDATVTWTAKISSPRTRPPPNTVAVGSSVGPSVSTGGSIAAGGVFGSERSISFSTEGNLFGPKEYQSNLKKKQAQVDRMKEARRYSSRLNRYAAKYLKEFHGQSHVDVVNAIEAKILATIRGHVVRFQLERQILAAVKIQRWLRDVVPVRQKWNAYWREEQARRAIIYGSLQNQLRTHREADNFQRMRSLIIGVQSGIRAIVVRENPLNQYPYVKSVVMAASPFLEAYTHVAQLNHCIENVTLVQKTLRDEFEKSKKAKVVKGKKAVRANKKEAKKDARDTYKDSKKEAKETMKVAKKAAKQEAKDAKKALKEAKKAEKKAAKEAKKEAKASGEGSSEKKCTIM